MMDIKLFTTALVLFVIGWLLAQVNKDKYEWILATGGVFLIFSFLAFVAALITAIWTRLP